MGYKERSQGYQMLCVTHRSLLTATPQAADPTTAAGRRKQQVTQNPTWPIRTEPGSRRQAGGWGYFMAKDNPCNGNISNDKSRPRCSPGLRTRLLYLPALHLSHRSTSRPPNPLFLLGHSQPQWGAMVFHPDFQGRTLVHLGSSRSCTGYTLTASRSAWVMGPARSLLSRSASLRISPGWQDSPSSLFPCSFCRPLPLQLESLVSSTQPIGPVPRLDLPLESLLLGRRGQRSSCRV